MVNSNESVGSQRQDHFVNLERRRHHEISVHTTHTSTSHSRSGSRVLWGGNREHVERNRSFTQEVASCCEILMYSQVYEP